MKKIFNYLLLFVVFQTAKAQSINFDSLKTVALNVKTDKEKIIVLTKLADSYSLVPDSEYYYATLAKDAAIKANDKDAEAYAISDIAEAFMNKGNYVQALELDLKILKVFQDLKDSSNIANTYYGLGSIYSRQRNIELAKMYYQKCFQLASKVKDYKDQYFGALSLSDVFSKVNQLDSALHYAKVALQILDDKKYEYSRPSALKNLAKVYRLRHEDALSDKYLKLAMQSAILTNDKFLGQIQSAYASDLFSKSKIDSALLYALKAKESLEGNSSIGAQFYIYDLLANIYSDKKQFEQAYKYQSRASLLNDSILNTTQLQQVSNLTFNEQKRQSDLKNTKTAYQSKLRLYMVLLVLTFVVISLLFLINRNRKQKQINELLETQKSQIEKTLTDLKSTQTQLIQSEKMASLGELTAGIAHEIQNPLNFVNNFSEVSNELIDEMKEELRKGNYDDANEIADDVKQNLEKINHHGNRAADIVKGMLQHSRSSSGTKEPTDINALCDEYVRLSYHGLRAKDKSFNATIKTDFDTSLQKINIIPQDIGRVVLNLLTNAFYVVDEKKKSGIEGYEPTVSISTKKIDAKVLVSVSDNGNGIPKNILDKIFQPFFTTKPTGQGTGLGLSLSYDIVKAHGGELNVETKAGEGSKFLITIPTV